MKKIDETLYQKLAADPGQSVALIIRTKGDPAPHLARLEKLGLQVGHQFKLLPSVSANGPAGAALKLLEEDWVEKIEEDRPVRTMSGQ
jgi:hypothetical protein